MKNKIYVICVKNTGYEASLELRKVYRTIPDELAETHAQIRVVDESGEDYLYPSTFFLPIQLSKNVESALALTM